MIHDLIMSEDGSLKTGGNLIIAPNGDLMAGENIQSLIYFSLYCGSSPLDVIRGERHSDKFELLMSEQRITIALLTQIERQALAQTQWIVDSGIVQNISVTVTTEQKPDTGTRVKIIFNVSIGDKIKNINLDDINKEYNADPFLPPVGLFVDERDGQQYNTIKIGSQIWMTENLNYDGGGIYGSAYDDDQANRADGVGLLYAKSEILNVIPDGWKLPSDSEFNSLINAFGGNTLALKHQTMNGNNLSGINIKPTGQKRLLSVSPFVVFSGKTETDISNETQKAYFFGRETFDFETLQYRLEFNQSTSTMLNGFGNSNTFPTDLWAIRLIKDI